MSFLLSAEPQPRFVLESHSNRLLAQFDTQLGILANRYLAFFQERSVNLVQARQATLNILLSGEVLRYPSQSSSEHPTCHVSDLVCLVPTHYGSSIIRWQPLMPHLTQVPNQLRREQHGIQSETI